MNTLDAARIGEYVVGRGGNPTRLDDLSDEFFQFGADGSDNDEGDEESSQIDEGDEDSPSEGQPSTPKQRSQSSENRTQASLGTLDFRGANPINVSLEVSGSDDSEHVKELIQAIRMGFEEPLPSDFDGGDELTDDAAGDSDGQLSEDAVEDESAGNSDSDTEDSDTSLTKFTDYDDVPDN
ncbi:hypothetical protein ACFQH6_03550 [Halobacteriaceae archaeon GCM10025711]